MPLGEYHRKRDFTRTAEPRGAAKKSARRKSPRRSYLIQKHAATRLHYDFTLEHRGVLLSWAVPKGPSLDPADKRLAVQVEDHPVEYGKFEGVIPNGQYGGGSVLLWDRGTWQPVRADGEKATDAEVDAGLRAGKLDFALMGEKLRGAWHMVRLRERGGGDEKNWLLMKRTDGAAAKGKKSIVDARPESVVSGKVIDEIDEIGAKKRARTWTGRGDEARAGKRSTSATASKPRSSTRSVRSRSASKRTATAKPPRKRSLTAMVAGASGARRAPLPGFVPVQLATLVRAAPEGEGWIHEVKYDGYRMLAELERGKVRWFSRNGLDWTHRFPALSPAIAAIGASRALIDGEVVVLDAGGVSQFHLLQQALSDGSSDGLVYFAFDLLHLDGYDLRPCALLERKRILQALLAAAPKDGGVRFSEHFESSGASFLRAACEHELEGVISKRAEAPYRSGRSGDWTKAKCGAEQELVVVGFTEPRGSRAGLGALVLAVNEKKRLRFAGRVGAGFDRDMLASLRAKLEPLRIAKPPVEGMISAENRRGVAWVEPRIVIEVAFTGWTADGLLRHAVFKGIREDKNVGDVVHERASRSRRSTHGARNDGPAEDDMKRAKRSAKTSTRRGTRVDTSTGRGTHAGTSMRRGTSFDHDSPEADAGSNDTILGVRVTHPERVLDEASGVTKLDIAHYYARAGALLLPHIAHRPLSIVRCPKGFTGACFFQKHSGGVFPESVGSISLRDSSGTSAYLTVDSVEGLISLVQMNVIELHPWGSRADLLEKPDRMFFDLDPAPDVAWKRVIEAALHLRDALSRMDIESFVKTTGGKGLHVVVPLQRKHTWDEVKAFSRALAFELARAEPKQYVATASKATRKGRIFVDYLRNSRGATAVAPYSVRARKGAPLSMPIAWKDLESLAGGDHFHLEHAVEWKAERRDPWKAFLRSTQVLPRAAGTQGKGGRSRNEHP